MKINIPVTKVFWADSLFPEDHQLDLPFFTHLDVTRMLTDLSSNPTKTKDAKRPQNRRKEKTQNG